MTPPATAAAAHRARPTAGPRRAGNGMPRRMSGALRPAPAGPALPRRPIAVPRPPASTRPFAEALGRRLRELPDHRFLGRLIGGRVWIPLVTVLLLGLVTMQVSMLKLNSGIGRAVERQSTLQRENAALRATNGRLSSDERVRAAALADGMRDPAASTVRFLSRRKGDAQLAVARMVAPSALVASAAASATTPAPLVVTPAVPVVVAGPPPGTTAAATTSTTPATTTPTTTPTTSAATTAPTATTAGTVVPTATTPITQYHAPAATPVTTAPGTTGTTGTTAPGTTGTTAPGTTGTTGGATP